MDGEQASNWAAAQGIGVGEDLIPAALRHQDFLEAVDRRRWLYEGPLLDRAIRRYRRLPGPCLFETHKRRLLCVWNFLRCSVVPHAIFFCLSVCRGMVGWLVKKTLPCSVGLAEKLVGTENSGTNFDQPLGSGKKTCPINLRIIVFIRSPSTHLLEKN
jgi:hypothetical protein